MVVNSPHSADKRRHRSLPPLTLCVWLFEGCLLLMVSLPTMDTETDTCPAVHQNGTAHRESPDASPAAAVLRLHFYHNSQGEANCGFLSYPPGDYVVEELCIDAAKACSKYSSCAGLHNAPPFMCFAVTRGIGPKIRLSRGHSETNQQINRWLVQCAQGFVYGLFNFLYSLEG